MVAAAKHLKLPDNKTDLTDDPTQASDLGKFTSPLKNLNMADIRFNNSDLPGPYSNIVPNSPEPTVSYPRQTMGRASIQPSSV